MGAAGASAHKGGGCPLSPPPRQESPLPSPPSPNLPPHSWGQQITQASSPGSHTFQNSSFPYLRTRDISTVGRLARSPFSFPSFLPKESIFLNFILPETIQMKTIQETRLGTKPRALIHLALSELSILVLKNPYSWGHHRPPALWQPHLPDHSGRQTALRSSPGLVLLLDPWSHSATSPSYNIQTSSVVDWEEFIQTQSWNLSVLCDLGQVTWPLWASVSSPVMVRSNQITYFKIILLLIYSAQACLVFLEFANYPPTSGPLHLLFPILESSFSG